jgi:hypothetical protein
MRLEAVAIMVRPESGCCDLRYNWVAGWKTQLDGAARVGLRDGARDHILIEGGDLPTREPAEQLFARLLEMHREAFENERFDVAYHLLAAALHAAEELQSAERLGTVGAIAEQRQRALDAQEPNHRLSTTSANHRGGLPQYTALVGIAQAVRGRIAAESARERARTIHP